MKDFFNIRQELTEAKVTVAKLRPGLKLNVFHSGASARNYGVKDENVYGGWEGVFQSSKLHEWINF